MSQLLTKVTTTIKQYGFAGGLVGGSFGLAYGTVTGEPYKYVVKESMVRGAICGSGFYIGLGLMVVL